MVKGWGIFPKAFIDSDSDQEFPPHVPIPEDYCRTCLTEKVRCSCQPTSDWSGELCVYRCTVIHNTHLWVPFSLGISQNKEAYNATVFNRYNSFITTLLLTITNLPLQYHKLYINTHLTV